MKDRLSDQQQSAVLTKALQDEGVGGDQDTAIGMEGSTSRDLLLAVNAGWPLIEGPSKPSYVARPDLHKEHIR
jgi:hypothetical protein